MRLTIACADYDRTRPVIDGRVKIEGCNAHVLCLDHEEMFVRALTSAEFDASELSFGRFALNVASGTTPYIGLPVLLSRAFRHSAIYIRNDRGIATPSDLRGRTLGVRDYSNTASVVARGMIEDEYSVRASEIRWVVGDVDHPERDQIRLPPIAEGFDVSIAAKGRLLSDMLACGELDGLIDFQPPRCYLEHHRVTRLFPDHERDERAYFARTRIFPIMHVLVLRRDLAERDPALAMNLYRAFDEARRIAMRDLWSPGALKISLPWTSEEYRRTVDLMGADFWSYGVSANRDAIACIPRYIRSQGLAARALALEELFEASTLST